jgi:TRAP-type C4-dicarboxylate transport system substrate-binding protein
MSPADRDQARERFSRWQSLPPAQRNALRDRWQKFQALSPQQQAAVRDNFHRFQQLPPERRQMLRQQWHNATPVQRQQMVAHAREQRQKRQMPHAGPGPHPPHR